MISQQYFGMERSYVAEYMSMVLLNVLMLMYMPYLALFINVAYTVATAVRLGALDPEKAVGIILTFILLAIIVAALWPTFENSVSDLQSSWNQSTFADVKNTLTPLAPLIPLLFGLSIVVGLIFAAVKIFKEG